MTRIFKIVCCAALMTVLILSGSFHIPSAQETGTPEEGEPSTPVREFPAFPFFPDFFKKSEEPSPPEEPSVGQEPAPMEEPPPQEVTPNDEPVAEPPQEFGSPFFDPGRQPYEAPPASDQEMPVRNMVETPEAQPRKFVDTQEIRDPFFLLRGYRDDALKILKPGTTVDGVRFNSYADTDKFIEKFYRQSNFVLDEVFGKVVYQETRGGCLYCHQGIEKISDNHNFSCTKCHGGNRRARNISKAHEGMAANPSDADHASKYCGKCHADQIEQVNRSLMATSKGIINLTRYAWGAQKSGDSSYSLLPGKGEQPLPARGKGHAVDDFLRVKCLRCHLQGEAPHRPGDYRGTGCAACHMVYSNDGLTLSRDRAIQAKQKAHLRNNKNRFSLEYAANGLNNPRGYPVMHKFTVAVPSVQCEHCHNVNGTGNEFEGMFAPAARPEFSMKTVEGAQPVLYGARHDFLLPDIHRERGMHCIDCHSGSEIKSGGGSIQSLHDVNKIRCEDCHGTYSKFPEPYVLVEADPTAKETLKPNDLNPNLRKKVSIGEAVLVTAAGVRMPHIKIENNRWVMFSKVTGKKHIIPVLKRMKRPAAHRIGKHMEAVECHACHARWSANEWGMNVVRDEQLDRENWQEWNFSDPSLQHLVFSRSQKGKPKEIQIGMLDWLTARTGRRGIIGDLIPGVWWDFRTESDWNSLILGKNSRGKYSVMKPRHQFLIDQKDTVGWFRRSQARPPVTEDEKPGLMMVPHVPHTIRKAARPCESCHWNPVAAGLGDPKLETIKNANDFLRAVKSSSSLPYNFQIRQMVDPRGRALQNVLPKKGVRFLSAQEISSLDKMTDKHRTFLYFHQNEGGLPRLLSRKEFPYDKRHEDKEKQYGPPDKDEDYFYDPYTNEFFPTDPQESRLDAPEPLPEPLVPVQDDGANLKTPQPKGMNQEGNSIREFSYKMFSPSRKQKKE